MPWVTLLYREQGYTDDDLRREAIKVLQKGVIKVGSPDDDEPSKVTVLNARLRPKGLEALIVKDDPWWRTLLPVVFGYSLSLPFYFTKGESGPPLPWYLLGVGVLLGALLLSKGAKYWLWRRPVLKRIAQLQGEHLSVVPPTNERMTG